MKDYHAWMEKTRKYKSSVLERLKQYTHRFISCCKRIDSLIGSFFRWIFLFTKRTFGALHSYFDLLLVILLVCLVYGLLEIDYSNRLRIQNFFENPQPIALPKQASYPQITNVLFPEISAQSAIVMDDDSKVIVYAKNPDLRLSLASTTKIMTALAALEYFHLPDILTVKSAIDTQGSGLGLYIGEELTFENLLKAALIYSANDAAETIAQNYPGGEKAFVARMNEKARLWHLENTYFINPAGLMDDGEYTTARDLVRLASIAIQNPVFARIVATKTARITSFDGKNEYTVTNRNKLLGIQGVDGIKTGYTNEAGEVLATSAKRNDRTTLLVVMKSMNRFADTLTLLDYASKVTYVSIYQELH